MDHASPPDPRTLRGLLRAHSFELGLLLLGVALPLILLAELAEDVWRCKGFSWDIQSCGSCTIGAAKFWTSWCTPCPSSAGQSA